MARPTLASLRPHWHRAAPWLALAAAWLLFELPTGVHDGSYQPLSLRPSGDFLLLVTLYQAGRALGYLRLARALSWTLASLLVLVRIDAAVFGAIMNEE